MADEQDALLADSVGVAPVVVLDTLTPAERLAPAAARQLAGRARRRVRGVDVTGADLAGRRRQREVVGAFLAAAREGDFEGLLEVLDPDVIARTEAGVATGAAAVARGAATFGSLAGVARLMLVDGAAGAVVSADGRVERALRFAFVRDRIAVIDIVTDPERVSRLDLRPIQPARCRCGPAPARPPSRPRSSRRWGGSRGRDRSPQGRSRRGAR